MIKKELYIELSNADRHVKNSQNNKLIGNHLNF